MSRIWYEVTWTNHKGKSIHFIRRPDYATAYSYYMEWRDKAFAKLIYTERRLTSSTVATAKGAFNKTQVSIRKKVRQP